MPRKGDSFQKVREGFSTFIYTSLATLPLLAGEFTIFKGLAEGDTFYLSAGIIAGGATTVSWARRVYNQRALYDSLDSLIEYLPVPSLAIAASIISGLVSSQMFIDYFIR